MFHTWVSEMLSLPQASPDMKHSSGVWLTRLSWWSSIHRSCQMRTVSLDKTVRAKSVTALSAFIFIARDMSFLTPVSVTCQMISQNPQEWRELSRLWMLMCGPVCRWKMVRWHHTEILIWTFTVQFLCMTFDCLCICQDSIKVLVSWLVWLPPDTTIHTLTPLKRLWSVYNFTLVYILAVDC